MIIVRKVITKIKLHSRHLDTLGPKKYPYQRASCPHFRGELKMLRLEVS